MLLYAFMIWLRFLSREQLIMSLNHLSFFFLSGEEDLEEEDEDEELEEE